MEDSPTCRSRRPAEPAPSTLPAGVLASIAELELGWERRQAAREARRKRGLPIGRPRALSDRKVEQVLKLHEAGTPVVEIAATFGVGRDTVYRVIRAAAAEEEKACGAAGDDRL